MNERTNLPTQLRLLKRRNGSSWGIQGLQGLSLIETMVVVTIVAVLASLAAPSMANLMQKNRLSAASSALQMSLNLARSEAVKRGTDARVTVAANTTAGSWNKGWTVFVDGTTNANAGIAPTADSASSCASNCVTRLEIVAPPSATVGFSQTGSLNYFTYNGQGRLITSTGAAANRSFWFFEANSDLYCVIINNTGRVRSSRVGNTQSCAVD
ncbi:GspH/FimT family pseudopilin [Rhodoferax saidenbachensis]|uniref:Type II secretion system protein H n=1 Tax=Rhodoferax saidenbachensis TaxID=1484693 RepID=A0ABU1ZU99_9BURK|nr:GspH/FimT family pseudopilin [Rhodoferax saidenbachensis]MDR7308425.1 type IV fimbrial biogenesis protein FimT [Rhodoferax saidenbachensis]